MIISKDMKPERQIYHLGALVVGILQKNSNKSIELFELFEHANAHKTISLYAFILTLDWLYLLGAITNDKGRIVKCF